MTETIKKENPLGTEKITALIRKFSIPAVISMLVGSLYNIIDQIFIGQGVGLLGNAATNIAFPIQILVVAVSLLLGIGGSTVFNLKLGAGNERAARAAAGGALSMLVIVSVIITAGTLIFLEPMLTLFGCTDDIRPYARDYIWVISLGNVFNALGIGATNIIRSDRSPNYSMACMLTGAILNIILDPLFIFVFGWGIKGGALATVVAQAVAAAMVVIYFKKYSHVKFKRGDFIPRVKYISRVCACGSGSFINQVAQAVVQIILNNVLKQYGAASEYGAEIPLACVGIIIKVNMVFFGIVIGVAQGCQPILGFNMGARKFDRVIKTAKTASVVCTIISVVFFLLFQLLPRQIVAIFGSGSLVDPVTGIASDPELYFRFSVRVFRIFLFMTFANWLQPLASTLFTSIGKARLGAFMSLTRQVVFLIPLLLILTRFSGIDGVVFATPVADAAAMVFALVFSARELKILKDESQKLKNIEQKVIN